MSGRRRLATALTLVVAIAVVIGIVLAVQSPSTTTASNTGHGSGTTTVQRRDLVQTDTESGTLSYAKARTVYNRLSGTITWLPSVGQVIKPGQTLYKVNGEPVVLMNGTTPAYRDLSAADSAGQDILQLNRDLVALGFTSEGIVVDDTWQAATTAAVEVFQESLGQDPTGILTLGQLVFLPGDQVISTVNASLGSDGGGGSGAAGPSSAADTSVPATAPEFVSLTSTTSAPTTSTSATTAPTTTAPTTTTPSTTKHGRRGKSSTTSQSSKTLAALIALLKAESAQLQAETARLKAQQASSSAGNKPSSSSKNAGSSAGGSSSAGSGSSGGAGGGSGSGTAILQTSSTQFVVTVDLDATKQSEAKVGESVTVDMPSGNTVNGRITAVSSVAQSSSSSGSGSGNGAAGAGSGGGSGGGSGSSTATIPVTIALRGHQNGAGLDQAAVSVNFAQAEATNVLSVPVTALLATGGGAYAVQEAASPHTLIPVTTGLFAAGYVQISGPGIYSGLQVTDSQG